MGIKIEPLQVRSGTSANPNAGTTQGGCPPGHDSIPFVPGVSDGGSNPISISDLMGARPADPHPTGGANPAPIKTGPPPITFGQGSNV